MNKITGYTHFRSYHDSIKDLDREDKRDILEAIDDFMFDDVEPTFTGFKNAIWTLIVPNLTTSKNKSRKYQEEPKKRKTKAKSKSNTNQNETKIKSNNSIDILVDKDQELDMEKKKVNENILSINNTKNIYEYFEENFGRTIAPIEVEKLDNWIKEFNFEIVKHAIDSSVVNGVKTFNYVEGILRNWKACGYKNIDEILAQENNHYASRIRSKSVPNELFDYNWLEEDENE